MNLYVSKITLRVIQVDISEISEITTKIMNAKRFAFLIMKHGKAPGKDGIATDVLKDAREEFYKRLAQLDTQCIQKKKIIPQNFSVEIIILLYKKGDNKDFGNCHPITLLLNIIQTIFVFANRLTNTQDEGFVNGYSTTAHLPTTH